MVMFGGMRQGPSGSIDDKHGMGAWLDGLGDFCQMQVHRNGVAAWHNERCSFAQGWTDGPEDVGRCGR
jgi:hypothetical protein